MVNFFDAKTHRSRDALAGEKDTRGEETVGRQRVARVVMRRYEARVEMAQAGNAVELIKQTGIGLPWSSVRRSRLRLPRWQQQGDDSTGAVHKRQEYTRCHHLEQGRVVCRFGIWRRSENWFCCRWMKRSRRH